MSQNQLGQSTSPYLLQHADNPVHWKIWNDEVFAQAKSEDKPILLSVGYAACHWCHVMAHESFEDIETAQLMNELFINIKVDREEHPDVDHIYQRALSVLGQSGGWPLTMFLTPSGQPFWGGTYFPKTALYGRPSFKDVLKTIADIYHTKKDDVSQNVTAIADALEDMSKPRGNGGLHLKAMCDTLHYIQQNMDPVHGGLKGAPKFPQPVLLDFLWRTNWIKKNPQIDHLLCLSLEKMCLGGIYDHLGGGFARYSTDEEWLAPHFEKMLYDNAQLVSLLTMVWRKHQNPLFKRSVFETIDWIFNEMRVETDNGFALASAYDADSEGVEGKFYVWNENEIDALLKEESPLFNAAYDVSSQGNWEGHNILRRVTPFENPAQEDKLDKLRQTLYQERKKRIWPARDDKVLCDWNAMMIKALSEAALVFDQPDWIKQAQDLYATLKKTMIKEGALYHSWFKGRHSTTAYLEDYANICLAALALYEATGYTSYYQDCVKWVDHLEDHFWDVENHGYHFADKQTVEGLNVRPKPINDSATPSGNGLMAHVLCDLYHLSGNPKYQERFNQLMQLFGNDDPNQIFAAPGLCSALIRFETMETIVIVGKTGTNDINSLINKAYLYPSPIRKVLLGDGQNQQNTPEILQGKVLHNQKATAYVCQNATCSPPLTEPSMLEAHLNDLTKQSPL
ncbi:thioredoxin domain-containing protein [Terasakiella sp.]|uniref:thioredoxin domain-containing protein n=1 Tax=Terasakiella sp. TaxID=2034861 RepID=UPI003AA81C90